MKFKAITCRAASKIAIPPRSYGYTIQIDPPEQSVIEGADIEGIGWWPYNPPKVQTRHFQGWYKHKADAEKRATELNNSTRKI